MDESLSHFAGPRHTLTSAQAEALHHVRSKALLMQSRMRETAEHVLARTSPASSLRLYELLLTIAKHARVTLNFHPDRILSGGLTVVEGLLLNGVYQSQFVTGVTNGSRSAFPGGDRDRWEGMLFGGAYQHEDVQNGERPKYGALNLMNYADGASPRFGSCYLRLRPHLLSRCTFTFGDSHTGPEPIGTIDVFEPLLAALLEQIETTGEALGSPNADVPSVVGRLLKLREASAYDAPGVIGRALDDYIEAQVHGDIDLSTDVEALVADPSYQETPVGDQLSSLCAQYNISLSWHPGFRLAAQAVPDDFRGPAMPPLAERVNRRFAITPGELTAATLGRAAAALHHDPASWQDWGTPHETFQHLKQLWHILVRYGRTYG